MSWEAATRIRSYDALILVFSLLTCHSLETSLNALGSCDPLTPSETQLEKCLVGNLSIKVVSPRGYKGSMSTEANPPVSPDAFNASSMSSLGETSSLSETCSVISMEKTHNRGNMLGIVRPLWTKVTESEQRIIWLKSMIARNLVVRDLDNYAKKIGDKLRSEEYRIREQEREILMGVMRLKLKDEMKNLIALNRKKDEKRRWLIEHLGKGKRLDVLLSRIRKEMIKIKTKLKKKYQAKLTHLETLRQKEIEEKKETFIVPDELLEFSNISLYNKEKRESLNKVIPECVVIGDVSLDEDERSVLRLNPKFAVLTRLDDETIERDIEVAKTKFRYEIKRQEEIELMERVDYDTLED